MLAHSGSRPHTHMQLVSFFFGSLQAYSPYDPQIEAQIPRCCPLCGTGLRGKGVYFRQVWLPGVMRLGVRRVQCRRPDCGLTISLLPSFCVPFKRYSSAIIESCLDSVLRRGDAVRHWCDRHSLTDRSTAGSWLRQFGDQAGKVITEGSLRLGIRQPCGGRQACRELWDALWHWASRGSVLTAAQPALCGVAPFLGLFRARL